MTYSITDSFVGGSCLAQLVGLSHKIDQEGGGGRFALAGGSEHPCWVTSALRHDIMALITAGGVYIAKITLEFPRLQHVAVAEDNHECQTDRIAGLRAFSIGFFSSLMFVKHPALGRSSSAQVAIHHLQRLFSLSTHLIIVGPLCNQRPCTCGYVQRNRRESWSVLSNVGGCNYTSVIK